MSEVNLKYQQPETIHNRHSRYELQYLPVQVSANKGLKILVLSQEWSADWIRDLRIERPKLRYLLKVRRLERCLTVREYLKSVWRL